MFAFKHRVGGFGTLETLPPDRGRSRGPISLHNAIGPVVGRGLGAELPPPPGPGPGGGGSSAPRPRPTTGPIALCSDIGPLLLPRSGGSVSSVPKPPTLCLKANIAEMVQLH